MSEKTYNEEYVLKLRDEAKKYRLQLRELQSTLATGDFAEPEEAISEPTPVQPTAPVAPAQEPITGQVPLQPATVSTQPVVPDGPKPISPTPNTVGVEPRSALDMLKNRQIAELKKDPKARAQLTDLYRTMLRSGMYSA